MQRRLLMSAVLGIMMPIVLWFSAILAYTSNLWPLHKIAKLPYMAVWGFYYTLLFVTREQLCSLCVSSSALIACLILDFLFYSLLGYFFLRWAWKSDYSDAVQELNL
jgi:hypothetical protein